MNVKMLTKFQLGLSTLHAVVAAIFGLVYMPRFWNADKAVQYECADMWEPIYAMTFAFIAFLCTDLAIGWYVIRTACRDTPVNNTKRMRTNPLQRPPGLHINSHSKSRFFFWFERERERAYWPTALYSVPLKK